MTQSQGTPLEGARILIVEDEFFLADDLARALRDAGAEPVGPISTIAQAEELVASQRLDAAVLDLNLHGEMASDFVQKLSQSELPCLIVSGYGEDAIPDCVAGMARLEKPVSPSVVVDSLAAELSRVRVS
jgi:DNA-binding response OmpR family regulator